MIAYIVKEISDKSFKLKIDYYPLIVRLMEPCTVISQLTNNIKRYPIDCLDYVIDGLLRLQVPCKIVNKFIGGEVEILTCLWAYNGSEDDTEDDDRFEVKFLTDLILLTCLSQLMAQDTVVTHSDGLFQLRVTLILVMKSVILVISLLNVII